MKYGEEVGLRVGGTWNRASNPGRAIHFSVFQKVQNSQPSIRWVKKAPSRKAKRPDHESDHSTPPSAEVKNLWSFTSTDP